MLAVDNVGQPATGNGVAWTPTTITTSMQFSNFTQGGNPTFSYPDSSPLLLFQYLTPQLSDKAANLSRVYNYPYFNID